jgi:hypothetical protein
MKEIVRANHDGSPVVIGVYMRWFRYGLSPGGKVLRIHITDHDKDRASLRSALLSEKSAFTD